jgi:hypothetical protein
VPFIGSSDLAASSAVANSRFVDATRSLGESVSFFGMGTDSIMASVISNVTGAIRCSSAIRGSSYFAET